MNYYTRKIYEFWEFLETQPPKFVNVNKEKLNKLALELAQKNLTAPDWQIPGALPQNNIAFVSHSFYACAIDFCFQQLQSPYNKFKTLDGKFSGSVAMGSCFYRHFGESPIKANDILRFTEDKEGMKKFFENTNYEVLPLIEERRQKLHNAALVIHQYFNDDPYNILRKTEFRVNEIVEVLSCCDSFSDYIEYPKLMSCLPMRTGTLCFNKRAQLWPLMYQGRALHSNNELPLLKDPDEIGPIADYQVPNALRWFGILEYSEELKNKIDNRIIIANRSDEELELRTATVYTVTELLNKINQWRTQKNLKPYTMIELDYYLWTAGQKSPYPHHLCPTTNY